MNKVGDLSGGRMKNLGQFLKEVRVELSKIVWPSFNEFVGATIIALFLIFLFSIYLGALDFGFSWLAKQIFITYGQ